MTTRKTSEGPPNASTRLADYVVGKSVPILIVFAVVVITGLVSLRDLRFHSSSETYSNENDPALLAFREHQELFAAEDPIIVASIGDTSLFEPARLERLARLHDTLSELPGVAEVWSIVNTGYARNVDGDIEIGAFMADVPPDQGGIDQLREEALSSPYVSPLLVSRDERTALLVVSPDAPIDDPLARPLDLVRRLDELRAAYEGPERIAIAGHPYTMTMVSEASRHDVLLFAPLTAIVLILLLVFLYRSLWAAIIPLTAAGSVSIVVVGMQAFRNKPLSEMEGMLPTLFLAIGVAYSMHLLDRYAKGQGSATERTTAALRRVLFPVVISGITTIAGFSALITSGMAGTRGFGTLGAFGVALMTVAVITVVPAMLATVAPRLTPLGTEPLTTRTLRGLRHAASRWPTAIMLGFVAFTLLATLGASLIKVDTIFMDWFPKKHQARTDIRALQDAGIGTTVTYLTIDTGKTNGALDPETLNGVHRLSERVEALPYVASASSLEPFLRDLHQVVSGERSAGLPQSQALLSQYILLQSSSEFASQIDRLVDFDRRYLSVALRTSINSSSEWWPAKRDIEAIVSEELPAAATSISGAFSLMFEASDDIAYEQSRSLMIALAIIVLALMLGLGSVKLGLLTLPSNVIPVLASFGLMGWLGVPLDSVNSIIACTVLGIIVDDSVHFVVSYRNHLASGSTSHAIDKAFGTAGRPILFTTIAITGSFLVFLFSSFEGIFQVGLLASAAVVVALFADLLLLPALLSRFAPAPTLTETSRERRRPRTGSALEALSLMLRSRSAQKRPTFGHADFVWLIHPRGLSDVSFVFPAVAKLPNTIKRWLLRSLWPIVAGTVSGLRDHNGQPVRGLVVAIPMTARQLCETPQAGLRKIRQCLALSETAGARAVGFGGHTGWLTGGGTLIGDLNLAAAPGCAVASVVAVDILQRACALRGIELGKATVAVVGAGGAVGTRASRLLAPKVGRLVRIDLPAKLEELREEELPVEDLCTSDLSLTSTADAILCATNHPGALIPIEELKQGAVLVDDSAPSNVDPLLANKRPDVLFLDGSAASVRGLTTKLNLEQIDPNDVPSCLAETALLALCPDGAMELADASAEGLARVGSAMSGHGISGARLRTLSGDLVDEVGLETGQRVA